MNELNNEAFITKVNNIFIKLLTAVMEGNLEDVDHFISDSVYQEYTNYINKLNEKNERQMYDELNAKYTYITSREKTETKEIVTVKLISRYMDYIIDKDTAELISGNDQKRIEVPYELIFEKNLTTKETKIAQKCPGCGANINVNNSGKCPYCGSIFDLENYDYILVSITKLT